VTDAGSAPYRSGVFSSDYSRGEAGGEGGDVAIRFADYFNGTNSKELLFRYEVSLLVRVL